MLTPHILKPCNKIRPQVFNPLLIPIIHFKLNPFITKVLFQLSVLIEAREAFHNSLDAFSHLTVISSQLSKGKILHSHV